MTFSEKDIIKFSNSYVNFPNKFYKYQKPIPVKKPILMFFNELLADELGIQFKNLNEDEIANIFSGNVLLPGCESIALSYGGHQFGRFVPQLGDGRAILLGEIIDIFGNRKDIQLKGSGQTFFSRRGDGRLALGPALREYIISEAMHILSVPTTRSLAVIKTGESVFRETALPGAVLTRIASSHIRVGTFEYFSAQGDTQSVKLLADYAIERHYPHAKESENPYQILLESVIKAQVMLMAKWMLMGFIHGVMNTDNTLISGETIDYGPCAFMDIYDPTTVFSSIDTHGRYAYGNQPSITLWNLSIFAQCLLPIIDEDKKKAAKMIEKSLTSFESIFAQYWMQGMKAKLGLSEFFDDDLSLIENLLTLMKNAQADYTLTFRYLSSSVDDKADTTKLESLFFNSKEFSEWLKIWRARLKHERASSSQITEKMKSINPAFIPRNHLVEEALESAVKYDDFSKVKHLISILNKPYEDQPENLDYMLAPKPTQQVYKTFCGT